MKVIDKELVLSLIKENCEGLEVNSVDDIIQGDQFVDKYFFNAATVLTKLLEELDVIEERLYE